MVQAGGGKSGTDHGKGADQPSSSKSDSNPQKKFKCYNCGVKGHFSKDCKEPKKKNPQRAMVAENRMMNLHCCYLKLVLLQVR
jgi:hypothetical protein